VTAGAASAGPGRGRVLGVRHGVGASATKSPPPRPRPPEVGRVFIRSIPVNLPSHPRERVGFGGGGGVADVNLAHFRGAALESRSF